MRRLFLHIGADKCGSSSLQALFSHNPKLAQRDGRALRYVLFKPLGIIGPVQIRQRTNRSPLGYVSSDPLKALNWRKPAVLDQVQRFLHRQPDDLITSCELWLRELATPQGMERLQQLLELLGSVELHLICCVRPPVEWLNSAWWQWGAWERSVPFETWLDRMLPLTNWDHLLQKVTTSVAKTHLHVACSKPDVITSVLDHLKVDRTGQDHAPRLNRSLPAAVLRLYQQQPQLRPDPNHCPIDFSTLAALSNVNPQLEPAPWVIRPSQVEHILQSSHEATCRLLQRLSPEEQHKMLGDPFWWEASAYADRPVEDPHHGPIPQLKELCAEMLQAYHALRLQTLEQAPR